MFLVIWLGWKEGRKEGGGALVFERKLPGTNVDVRWSAAWSGRGCEAFGGLVGDWWGELGEGLRCATR